jgi:hypothetical protein
MGALADRLGGGEAEEPLAARRPVADGAVGVAQHDGAELEGVGEVGHRLQPFLERRLLALQGFLPQPGAVQHAGAEQGRRGQGEAAPEDGQADHLGGFERAGDRHGEEQREQAGHRGEGNHQGRHGSRTAGGLGRGGPQQAGAIAHAPGAGHDASG